MATTALKEQTRELIAQFCAGNDAAFAKLYDLYVQMLHNYGNKLTQDEELLKDCIHDVFVKVYMKRQDKNSINNLASYLIISLKNRLLQPEAVFADSLNVTATSHNPRFRNLDVEDLKDVDYDRILRMAKERTANAAAFTPLRAQPHAPWYAQTAPGCCGG